MSNENSNFLLTIAIPTYNRKRLLKRALESIVPQLNSNVEILVSDNASDDGTDKMMKSDFPNIRYIRNETNMGSDYNFLQCYREANGEYVMLLGSDDRFSIGALAYLTGFLVESNCDIVLMNYKQFDTEKEEVYIKNSEHIKNYKTKQDIVTEDRELFMKYADHSIGFMSATVIKKVLLSQVKEKDKFIGTYFIHTCLMLEAVKGKHVQFGIVMKPLIEQNVTDGDDEMSRSPEKFFEVWGKAMYWVYCEHAVACGFSKRQMKKIYIGVQRNNWAVMIIRLKSEDNECLKQQFWKYGYPVLKKCPLFWLKTMPYYLVPEFVAKFYRVKLRPLIKRKKQ